MKKLIHKLNNHYEKPKYVKSVMWLLVLMLVVSFLGYQSRISEKKANQLAKTVFALTTYKQPELAGVTEQNRARAIIKKIWGKDARTGITIAVCESGLREKVIGITYDVGYFQVSPIHGFTDEDMQNGVANASYAYTLYKEQSFQPWKSSRSCWESKI